MPTTTTPAKPGPIPRGDRANFGTIKAAHRNGDLALISAIRKSDGQRVSLICAMAQEPDPLNPHEMLYCPKPLAVMIEGDPFELFEDPTAR